MTAAASTADGSAHTQSVSKNGVCHTVFAVEGMRCGGCARSIEKAVSALAGVDGVQVNSATGRAAVDWRPQHITLSRILKAVDGAGFKSSPLAGEQASATYHRERRVAIKRIGLAGLGMMQTMMFVYALYAAGPGGIDADLATYMRIISMLVATPVLLYSGAPFFTGAWRNLQQRTLGMDVPVALAIGLAYAASVYNALRGEGEVYFDSVTMFIFFLLAGRFVEMTTRHRSLSSTEALARSLPATALRRREDGTTERVPVSRLRAGDQLSIPKGAIIPVDAALRQGEARVDESLVTGESRPVTRHAGEALLGGSVNTGNAIEVIANSDVAGSMIAWVVTLLQQAQAQRPRIAQVADRAAAWFVALILVLTAIVAIGWSLTDPARAFPAVLAILVVTCPCAFSLATPTAVAAATNYLASQGLLVTRADALERLAHVTTAVFDKTGTLTTGVMAVSHVRTFNGAHSEHALKIAAALERSSTHPLAAAFAGSDDPRLVVAQPREAAGQGVEAQIEGALWRLGRREFVREICSDPELDAPSVVLGDELYLGTTSELVAEFVVADSVRGDAKVGIDALRAMGLEVVIASGDGETAVRRAAATLGVSEAVFRQTPEGKMSLVRTRQGRGERVLMIGDGINDGPVLAATDVSCAMGRGSAIAHAAADLLLLKDELPALASGVRTARRTLQVMRQNLHWALAYNVCAVPLAAFGLIPPWVAAIGMSLSSLVVVLNAQRAATS